MAIGWVRDESTRIAARVITGVVAVALAAVAAILPRAAMAAPSPGSAVVFDLAADATTRAVTLSFDADWWSPGEPATVLAVLADNGIVAGMGITGRYAERYPANARMLIAAGHKLINHSYGHPAFSTLTQAQRFEELARAERAFAALGLSSGGWVRVPFGDGRHHLGVNRDLALAGYPISFDWTFDTTGYRGATCDEISRRVRRLTVPGAIIVMHLSRRSTDTVCLPTTIDTLRSMGYGFTDPWTAITTGARSAPPRRAAPLCPVAAESGPGGGYGAHVTVAQAVRARSDGSGVDTRCINRHRVPAGFRFCGICDGQLVDRGEDHSTAAASAEEAVAVPVR